MASPIQTVIGKGTSNPLIAEGLLKILKEPNALTLPKTSSFKVFQTTRKPV